MYHTNYTKSLILSLTILILTTLVSVNSQANKQPVQLTPYLDRTCTTTMTSITDHNNVLTNSTFGTGNNTTTTTGQQQAIINGIHTRNSTFLINHQVQILQVVY